MQNYGNSCQFQVEGDSSYEERKAARTTEIEALKQAETILDEAFSECAWEGGQDRLQIRAREP